MVLMSKETEIPDKKVIEVFVEKEKIRIEHLVDGKYQIQVSFQLVNSDRKLRVVVGGRIEGNGEFPSSARSVTMNWNWLDTGQLLS